jgi:hypothetical protein
MYYKLEIARSSSIITGIVKIEDNLSYWIPMDESNSDYQLYLEWLAEGNEPNDYQDYLAQIEEEKD